MSIPPMTVNKIAEIRNLLREADDEAFVFALRILNYTSIAGEQIDLMPRAVRAGFLKTLKELYDFETGERLKA